MSIAFPLFLALVLSVPMEGATFAEAAGAQQHGCPAEQPNSELRVRNLLSSPLLPEIKARYDFGTATLGAVRLLTTRHDGDVCGSLWAAMAANGTKLTAGDRVAFYQSGDTFFVPISRQRRPGQPGRVRLDGYSSLDVYDSDYRLVGRFGA